MLDGDALRRLRADEFTKHRLASVGELVARHHSVDELASDGLLDQSADRATHRTERDSQLDLPSQLGAGTIDSNAIVRGGYAYVWTSASPKSGFKVKTADPATEGTGVISSDTFSFNADQIGDYDCEAWTTDASKFELPASVTFADLPQQ